MTVLNFTVLALFVLQSLRNFVYNFAIPPRMYTLQNVSHFALPRNAYYGSQ